MNNNEHIKLQMIVVARFETVFVPLITIAVNVYITYNIINATIVLFLNFQILII